MPADMSMPEQDAPMLTVQEERAAREVYNAYDLDGMQSLTKQELLELLVEQNWCMDEDTIDSIVSRYCSNDEAIGFDGFLTIYRTVIAKQPTSVRKSISIAGGPANIDITDLRQLEADQREAFEALDTTNCGYLRIDEMKEVLRITGIPDTDGDDYDGIVLEQMELADSNQDGRISFEEFVLYRNAVLGRFLAQSRKDQCEVPDKPSDPWAWDYFAH